ncbi:MAG TPA: type I methionyl aminopeptidase [Candidatus Saccharimonadales bacterium]|nr:type I methionyl aminopeptidase [Candidatus Saccharimonadales bacterium]
MTPKTAQETEWMRQGGRQLGRILKELSQEVKPGVSGKDIAGLAAQKVKEAKLQPVLLGYDGFPDVICISVNDSIVHGVPTKTRFKEGDLVKLDLTVANRGMVIDSAITVFVGNNPPADVKRLIGGTKKALDRGISAIKGEGTRVGDIANAVQDVLNSYKLGIIRDLVGHGVGHGIHEDPNVPNYGLKGTGPVLPAGATIAIEPMASLGDWQIDVLKDGWTIAMRDHSLGAHFEHTVLITDDGAEILTLA